MPLYYFHCRDCAGNSRRILTPGEVKGAACRECGGKLKRNPKPPSTQVMERLDNGVMKRALERFADAEELHRDRAANDPRHKA